MTNKKEFELIQREVLYAGFFRMVRYQIKFSLFGGGMSQAIWRELMERDSAVAILPYDPILDQVVLIEQFRVGAVDSGESPWLIETVAGLIGKDEKKEQVAIREAQEESGCEILDIYPICEYFVSPGGCNEKLSLYCGRIASHTTHGIHGLSEENEDIRAMLLPLDEALQWLRDGKVKTSPAIIALQWLQLNREWLKKLWQKN